MYESMPELTIIAVIVGDLFTKEFCVGLGIPAISGILTICGRNVQASDNQKELVRLLGDAQAEEE